MACKEVGKEFQYGQCLRMQRSQPDLTKLLEIALFLSVDMKELITDKRNAMIEEIMRDKIISEHQFADYQKCSIFAKIRKCMFHVLLLHK